MVDFFRHGKLLLICYTVAGGVLMGKIIFFNTIKINILGERNKMCRELVKEIRQKSKKIEDMQYRTQEVLDYFNVTNFEEGTPIVNILVKMGFKIYQSDLEPEGLSAYIAVNPKFEEVFGSNKITCVNADDSVGHKRFALAHELSHYLFDFDESKQLNYYNTYFPNQEEDKEEEKRANQFAANLLMPEKIFRDKLKTYENLQSKAETISALGRDFRVSPTAVLRRCQELKIVGYEN